jgi:hypothetical protein
MLALLHLCVVLLSFMYFFLVAAVTLEDRR